MKNLFVITSFLVTFLSVTTLIARTNDSNAVLDQVMKDACKKEVVLLGEASHGDGRTFEFKAALVQRLVNECNFNAFFIESGIYDFLNFNTKLKAHVQVIPNQISDGVGRLWSSTQEFQSLIPFLFEKAKTGVLVLGGLDDQINSTARYAQHEMPNVLTSYLDEKERTQCLSDIQQYTSYQYSDQRPYSLHDKERLLTCLTQIKEKIIEKNQRDHEAMVDSLVRLVGRDFVEDQTTVFNKRDESMYLNFQQLKNRLPSKSKIIVWAATVHAAKNLSLIAGSENRTSLGSLICRDFLERAFSLGFSAYSGKYAMVGHPIRDLEVAPPDSVEGSIPKRDLNVVYLDKGALLQQKKALARPLNYIFNRAEWGKVLDGLVIFKEEKPAVYLK